MGKLFRDLGERRTPKITLAWSELVGVGRSCLRYSRLEGLLEIVGPPVHDQVPPTHLPFATS